MKKYDYIIVGTGQATGLLLPELMAMGGTIAVIEGKAVGGSCVNTGCTPTKTLVAAAKTAYKVETAGSFGVKTGQVQIDFAKVMERMNSIRHGGRDGFTRWLRSEPRLDFYEGFASFVDQKILEVNGERLQGEKIFLHTGTRARKPALPGIDEIPWLDNEALLDLHQLPEHLIILGGSYIGLEFAQIFRRLGAKVTVLEKGPQIMFREDRDVAEKAHGILAQEGIDFYTDVSVTRLAQQGNIQVELDKQGQKQVISGSHLLAATGRAPNSDKLALDKAGIETDEKGYIRTDDKLQTNIPGVYAIGDVNGRGAFTHTSVNDGEVVLDHVKGGSRSVDERIAIYAMFIDPPLGRIGLSEKQALKQGYKVLKGQMPMAKINRAREMGETAGFIKILIDADTEKFLGVSILGVGGDEIINHFAPFFYYDLTYRDFRKMVLVHPTVSELLPWILDSLQRV